MGGDSYGSLGDSSSSSAVLEPGEAPATDSGCDAWNRDRDADCTKVDDVLGDVGQSVGSGRDQEEIGDATIPTEFGTAKHKAPPGSRSVGDYSDPAKFEAGTCNGEIIEVLDSKVVCWIEIGERLRVRSALAESLFDDLPKCPGAEFRWCPDSGAVLPMEFDNDELVAEFDQLEREWDEELKHSEPRMAD